MPVGSQISFRFGEAELLRHHADDRRHDAIQSNGRAGDVAIALEARLPEAMADECDRRRPGRRVGLGEVAADNWRDAEDGERVRRHSGAAQPFRKAAVARRASHSVFE